MVKIATFASIAGGAGKSTQADNFSEWLAEKGYKTLAIDQDNQANLTHRHGIQDDEGTVRGVYDDTEVTIRKIKENLYLLPASMYLDEVERKLEREENRAYRLLWWMQDNADIINSFDYIVIDGRPDFNWAMRNTAPVSNVYFVPVTPDDKGVEGWKNLEAKLRLAQKEMVDTTTRKSLVTAAVYCIGNRIAYNRTLSNELRAQFAENEQFVAFIPEKSLFPNEAHAKRSIWDNPKLRTRKEHTDFFKTMEQQYQNMKNVLDANN